MYYIRTGSFNRLHLDLFGLSLNYLFIFVDIYLIMLFNRFICSGFKVFDQLVNFKYIYFLNFKVSSR